MNPRSIRRIKLDYVLGKRSSKQLGDFSWELSEKIIVTLSNGETVIIPKGFKTDLSSVPEFFWGVQKPFGDFILAPIVHDFMYRTRYKVDELGFYDARLFADKEMLSISKKTNFKKWHNRLDNIVRFYEVRLLGWYTYRYGMK